VPAIVFLEIVKSDRRTDEIRRCVRQWMSSVGYTEQIGADRIEVHVSAADVDDEQARERLEQALDSCGDEVREHLRIVYP